MKQAISQEPMSDSSHSCIPAVGEGNASSSNRVKSAAMLGIALSVGASGAFVSQSGASAAVSVPVPSNPTEASDDAKVSAPVEAEGATASQQLIVDYHTVESGESLWQIAQQHQVGLRELKLANALAPETSIRVGQVLKVPGSEASSQNVALAQSEPAQLIAGITADEQAATPSQSPSAQLATSEPIAAVSSDRPSSPAMSIEIADASPQEDTAASEVAPVVTTLAASPTFSNYQVQTGDTLGSIAAELNIASAELVRVNGLSDPNVILAGTTLVVPAAESITSESATEEGQSPLKRVEETPSAGSLQQRETRERLAYLRSTATSPDSARILDSLRRSSPEEPASVGGEPSTEQDLLSTHQTGTDQAGVAGVDPYVANLLEEVQEIRVQAVPASEAETTEVAADDSSLLASPATESTRAALPPRVALAPETGSAEIDSNLLAAAPLSPDAYIPAQRSQAGQVVSPDMPILPPADEYLPEAPSYFNGYIWPTQGTITSGYGRRWGRMHRGIDVAGPVGTPIVAAGAGVIEQAGWNSGGYGNIVEIRHPDGSMTRYAHNNRLNVSAGQNVRQGQQIAEMGSTGYSTGPHLHFEVHPSGQGAVNPVAYLPSR